MKRFKQIITIFSSLLSLCSCNNTEVNRIALFAYTKTDPFLNSLVDSISNNFSKYYKVDVFYASNDQSIQNEQIAIAVNSASYSAFIVNLCDRMVANTIVKKCQTTNKPLIFFNRAPEESVIEQNPLCYFVGTDASAEGNQQATIVKQLFNYNAEDIYGSKYDFNNDGKLSTLILKGEIGHQDAELRTNSAISSLNNFNIEYAGVSVCNWIRGEAYAALNELGDKAKDIELIISNNDEMAIGAANYFESINSTRSPIIIGVDCTVDGKKAVDEGKIAGTVVNDSIKQAEYIYNIAIDLLSKGSTSYSKNTYSKSEIYVKKQ